VEITTRITGGFGHIHAPTCVGNYKKNKKTKKNTKKTSVFYKSLCVFFLRLKKNKKSGSAQHGRNQIAAVLPLIRICRRCFMTTSGLSVPRHWSFQFFQDFQFFDGAKLEQLQFHPQQESQPPLADEGRQVAERLRERPCRGSHERV
jgi:hypothetical protein